MSFPLIVAVPSKYLKEIILQFSESKKNDRSTLEK